MPTDLRSNAELELDLHWYPGLNDKFGTDHNNVSLEHFDIGECPPYSAVSYMWGSINSTQKIYVNGCIFTIGQNLWHFLDYIRKNVRNGYFWIDQICIQQNDSAERNHQVKMMGLIYEKASEVLVWPGLPEIAAESHGESALKICQRPYWRRLWVVQEIMLGRKVTIVDESQLVSWHVFFHLALNHSTRARVNWTDERRIPDIVRSIYNEKRKFEHMARATV